VVFEYEVVPVVWVLLVRVVFGYVVWNGLCVCEMWFVWCMYAVCAVWCVCTCTVV
jgi:hypothetical protein